jgi:hypothetical protein
MLQALPIRDVRAAFGGNSDQGNRAHDSATGQPDRVSLLG